MGLFPAPSYAVARNHAFQAQVLGCTKAGAQRLVCAIVMLDEALSNKQAAPISPLEKLALTPKNIYDPRMPDAHQWPTIHTLARLAYVLAWKAMPAAHRVIRHASMKARTCGDHIYAHQLTDKPQPGS